MENEGKVERKEGEKKNKVEGCMSEALGTTYVPHDPSDTVMIHKHQIESSTSFSSPKSIIPKFQSQRCDLQMEDYGSILVLTEDTKRYFFVFFFLPHLAVLRGCSWLFSRNQVLLRSKPGLPLNDLSDLQHNFKFDQLEKTACTVPWLVHDLTF